MRRAPVLVALFAAVGCATASAQAAPPFQAGPPREAAVAVAHLALTAPRIDGVDDDAVWREAAPMDEFRQFQPRADAAPSFRTEFRVAYDARNLFVFVRMFDPHPDSIMHALSRRDVRGPSDQIKVLVDSYADRRSGFEFAVNPDGVKRDYAMFDDGNEDVSWNGVWDVATRVDSLGWTAEFRIPMSQLRYASRDRHTFGFGVWRDIERYAERVSWPRYVVTESGLSSQLGTLTGLEGISDARRLEVTPYAVTKNVQRVPEGGTFERDQQFAIGGDVKIGLTPNVTLDATVNPDFGQVEADPAVVNLTAFETFFPERRPFFVEGTGLYRFQLNCYIVVDCSTNEGLFYSRRIGRAPQLGGLYGDASTSTATPILAATKLTGRTRGGLSFGVLDAVTRRVEGVDGATAEPLANYALVRAQQDLRGGESEIGLIATAVNRDLDEFTAPYLHRSAQAVGANVRHRFRGGDYELNAQLAGTRVAGSPEAILATQRSAVHYFQQPGDDPEADPTRTSLTGTAAQLKFGKYGGGITRFETSLLRQSPGFDVNDLGFLRRADRVDWSTWAALSFRDARRLFRWAQLNGNHWETWNTSGLRLQNAINVNGHVGLHNNWDAHAGVTVEGLTESYCDRCTRGGPPLRESRGIYPWFGVNTDGRKTVSASMWVNLWYGDEGRTDGYNLSPSVNVRVSTRLQARLGLGYTQDHEDNQWFGNFTDEGGGATHYAFARLDQRTVSLGARINYTATPDLTFEFYGQPFVSTGRYSDLRELSATPDAPDYDDRFQPYEPPASEPRAFTFAQVRTNAVLRWEYLPGSTLYVVWTHGRQDSRSAYSDRSWTRDYRELFELHPDNTFLVKLAYWLSR